MSSSPSLDPSTLPTLSSPARRLDLTEFLYSAVHLVGHYVRQEDFDQDPYSDSEADYDSDDESIDSELEESMMEGLSGMVGEDEDDDEEERLIELKEEPKKA